MYCRTCGKQHGEEVNYCPNEGSMEIAGTIDAVTLEKILQNTAEVVAVKMLKKFILSKVWVFFICCEEKEQTVKLPTMDGALKLNLKQIKPFYKKVLLVGLLQVFSC